MVFICLAYGYARRRRLPIKITVALAGLGLEDDSFLMTIFLSCLPASDYHRVCRTSRFVARRYRSNGGILAILIFHYNMFDTFHWD